MLKVKHFLGKTFHPVHYSAHLVYFAAVAFEGHGIYAMAAGGLFFVTVLGIVLGEES